MIINRTFTTLTSSGDTIIKFAEKKIGGVFIEFFKLIYEFALVD